MAYQTVSPGLPQKETMAHGMATRSGGKKPRHGTHVAHETIYAGNCVKCMRLPRLVLVSK